MEVVKFFKDKFRVNKEEEDILKLTYVEPYLEFTAAPLFHATNTACPHANDLLLFIENTQGLNERAIELKERISKGLTPSSSYYRDWVEEGILNKLIEDAKVQYKNEMGESIGYELSISGRMMVNKLKTSEIRLYFKLPNVRKDLKEAITRQSRVPKNITEPKTRLDNLPIYYGGTKGDNSNYQTWGVYVTFDTFRHRMVKGIYDRLKQATGVVAGKIGIFDVGFSSENKGKYIQVYVYDYAGRDWAFQHAIQYLVEHENIKLDYSRVEESVN